MTLFNPFSGSTVIETPVAPDKKTPSVVPRRFRSSDDMLWYVMVYQKIVEQVRNM